MRKAKHNYFWREQKWLNVPFKQTIEVPLQLMPFVSYSYGKAVMLGSGGLLCGL